MEDDILATIQSITPDMVAIRQDIHAHPETGFEEVRTAGIVAEQLRSWGLEVTTQVGRTGVVGTLKGSRPGNRAIGLRADMDALDILETTGLPYASTIPGKMHACGHDGHTAMLLGAARTLAKHRDFAGTVHFIFQPAEEGLGGAVAMLEDGLLERFPMESVWGMHNWPSMPVGQFGAREGAMMAASDSWTVTFKGTGGHGGAGAHLSTDASLALAHFITGVQTIVSRNVSAMDTAVVSVGYIAGGAWGSPNVMPSEVVVRGTARSFRDSTQNLIERRMGEIAQASASMHGCTAELDYERRYVPLVNDAASTTVAMDVAAELVGEDKVKRSLSPVTGAEDFSFMLRKRPGAYVFIGNGVGADGKYAPVHTPKYDFNDEALPFGVQYWVALARKELAGS